MVKNYQIDVSLKQFGWLSIKKTLMYQFPYFENIKEQLTGSELISKFNDYNKVKSYLLLMNESNSLTLLSYLLLSFTYKLMFKNPANVDSHILDLFGICICGKSKKVTYKTIANIFYNLVDRNPRSINSITLKYSISDISDKTKTNFLLGCHSDYPIIISTDKGFKKDSVLVSKAMNVLNNKSYSAFPVFASPEPFYREDILTIEISNNNIFNSIYEDILVDYPVLIRFMYEYTRYLSKLPHIYFHEKYEVSFNLLDQDEMTDPNKLQKYRLLLYAYCIFLDYGKSNEFSLNNSDIDRDKAIKIFKQASLEEIVPSDISHGNDILSSFGNFIRGMFKGQFMPDYIHWIGKERNPPHLECYYVDYDKYWFDFIRSYIVNIDKKAFESILFDNSVIYVSKNRYDIYRRYDKIKHKCLVIYKDKLDNIDLTALLPTPFNRPVKRITKKNTKKVN
ncbi:MAG: hypothetical protein AB9835_02295 [Eubacteriales bacterium]